MLGNLFQDAHSHPILQGICTFVDHSTRGKLSFAYLRDYRTIPRPHSRAASLSSPSTNSSNRPLGLFNFSPDEVKLPISPCSSTAGLLQLYSHNYIFSRQIFLLLSLQPETSGQGCPWLHGRVETCDYMCIK